MDCAFFPSSRDTRLFRLALLRWYDLEKRDLPWRKTKNPYHVWVSEIMLQQTRVGAVLEHYREFLARFPDLETLAGASLDAVLAAWSGLGYYRRARNLHAAAQKVIAELDGKIPGGRSASPVTGHRPLYCRGDRKHRLRGNVRGARRERRARSSENPRARRNVGPGTMDGGRGSAEPAAARRLQSGDDGIGRHRLSAG